MTDGTEELRVELTPFLKGKSIQSWKWIKHNGVRIEKPKIENGIVSADGDHSEGLILEALIGANRRLAERRSASAKKAAATRAKRVEKLVYQEAKALIDGRGIRSGRKCRICGKEITDEQSQSRGIGSDCWQHVLRVAQTHGAEHVFKPREPSAFEVIRLENEGNTHQRKSPAEAGLNPNVNHKSDTTPTKEILP